MGHVGISELSALWSIPTLKMSFPWSCPEDVMHTVYLNAAQNFWHCFNGSSIARRLDDDDFILPDVMLRQIGFELEAAGATIPASIGEKPINIYTNKWLFDATTWQDWLCMYSRILFHRRLPTEHYQAWCKFVKAVNILTRYRHSLRDIQLAKTNMIEWMQHFERYHAHVHAC